MPDNDVQFYSEILTTFMSDNDIYHMIMAVSKSTTNGSFDCINGHFKACLQSRFLKDVLKPYTSSQVNESRNK